jgi:2,3-bisphosphoglycerate-independent phosphoglycerate mutase
MSTKYVLVIPDGAADEPQEGLGGKTPLESAQIPEMDRIAREGRMGLASHVPAQFLPGSDVATLSLFGYDPVRHFTGRAPLEAAAMGVGLALDDWAIRCNLMTIIDGRMTDFTASHISSAEGRQLIDALQAELGGTRVDFHAGVSYRNLMVYHGTSGGKPLADDTRTTPPHDVPDQLAADHLPTGSGASMLIDLQQRGSRIVADHPVNQARTAAGKRPANAIWLWGQGRAPALPAFANLWGLKGAIISAVDLVRGVGVLAGWDRIDVPGATGYLDTDYAAKGKYAIEALKNHDIVCVHIEAPDEASHEGNAAAKVESLERIDAHIVGPLRQALTSYSRGRILISPDHATLLRNKAHDRALVPWAMAGRGVAPCGLPYHERAARLGGERVLDEGWRLMQTFLE